MHNNSSVLRVWRHHFAGECWFQGSLDCSQSVNVVQYNNCMTTLVECGGLCWSHTCMSFIWMVWTEFSVKFLVQADYENVVYNPILLVHFLHFERNWRMKNKMVWKWKERRRKWYEIEKKTKECIRKDQNKNNKQKKNTFSKKMPPPPK